MFARIKEYFDLLKYHGPWQGYYPELPKKYRGRETVWLVSWVKVCKYARYLGGYIGDEKSKRYWMQDLMETWDKNINVISKVAWKYPQKSYAAVVPTIQSELIFLQRVTSDTGDTFAGMEIWYGNPFFFWKKNSSHPPYELYVRFWPRNSDWASWIQCSMWIINT